MCATAREVGCFQSFQSSKEMAGTDGHGLTDTVSLIKVCDASSVLLKERFSRL